MKALPSYWCLSIKVNWYFLQAKVKTRTPFRNNSCFTVKRHTYCNHICKTYINLNKRIFAWDAHKSEIIWKKLAPSPPFPTLLLVTRLTSGTLVTWLMSNLLTKNFVHKQPCGQVDNALNKLYLTRVIHRVFSGADFLSCKLCCWGKSLNYEWY